MHLHMTGSVPICCLLVLVAGLAVVTCSTRLRLTNHHSNHRQTKRTVGYVGSWLRESGRRGLKWGRRDIGRRFRARWGRIWRSWMVGVGGWFAVVVGDDGKEEA
jgi:hypothetical protein